MMESHFQHADVTLACMLSLSLSLSSLSLSLCHSEHLMLGVGWMYYEFSPCPRRKVVSDVDERVENRGPGDKLFCTSNKTQEYVCPFHFSSVVCCGAGMLLVG